MHFVATGGGGERRSGAYRVPLHVRLDRLLGTHSVALLLCQQAHTGQSHGFKRNFACGVCTKRTCAALRQEAFFCAAAFTCSQQQVYKICCRNRPSCCCTPLLSRSTRISHPLPRHLLSPYTSSAACHHRFLQRPFCAH